MPFSFTLAHKPGDELLSLINEHKGEISHIYLLSPFQILRDSEEEHARKLDEFAGMIGSIGNIVCDKVFTLPDTCMGGWQTTGEFHRALLKTMDEVGKLGITGVSVTDPYLTEFFRSSFPPYDRLSRFSLFWGMGGKLTHEIKLRYLNSLDLSLVSIHPSMNRNHKELSPLLGRMLGRAEVVVNSGCPSHCTMETFCRAVRFHLKEDDFTPEEIEIILKAYRDECKAAAPGKARNLLSLPLILPEHLDYYFEECGADLFQVLTPPDDEDAAIRILGYYFKRRSPENIEDLIYRPMRDYSGESLPVSMIKDKYREIYSAGGECGEYKRFFDNAEEGVHHG